MLFSSGSHVYSKNRDKYVSIIQKLTIDDRFRVSPEFWCAVGFPLYRQQNKLPCRGIDVVPAMLLLDHYGPLQVHISRRCKHHFKYICAKRHTVIIQPRLPSANLSASERLLRTSREGSMKTGQLTASFVHFQHRHLWEMMNIQPYKITLLRSHPVLDEHFPS